MAQLKQRGPLAWKRVYVDLAPATHAALVERARKSGKPAKALFEELVERAFGRGSASSKSQRRKRK